MIKCIGLRNIAAAFANHNGELNFIIELLCMLGVTLNPIIMTGDGCRWLAEKFGIFGIRGLSAAGAGHFSNVQFVIATHTENILVRARQRGGDDMIAQGCPQIGPALGLSGSEGCSCIIDGTIACFQQSAERGGDVIVEKRFGSLGQIANSLAGIQSA